MDSKKISKLFEEIKQWVKTGNLTQHKRLASINELKKIRAIIKSCIIIQEQQVHTLKLKVKGFTHDVWKKGIQDQQVRFFKKDQRPTLYEFGIRNRKTPRPGLHQCITIKEAVSEYKRFNGYITLKAKPDPVLGACPKIQFSCCLFLWENGKIKASNEIVEQYITTYDRLTLLKSAVVQEKQALNPSTNYTSNQTILFTQPKHSLFPKETIIRNIQMITKELIRIGKQFYRLSHYKERLSPQIEYRFGIFLRQHIIWELCALMSPEKLLIDPFQILVHYRGGGQFQHFFLPTGLCYTNFVCVVVQTMYYQRKKDRLQWYDLGENLADAWCEFNMNHHWSQQKNAYRGVDYDSKWDNVWRKHMPERYKNDEERAGSLKQLYKFMLCQVLIRQAQNLNYDDFKEIQALKDANLLHGRLMSNTNNVAKRFRKLFDI